MGNDHFCHNEYGEVLSFIIAKYDLELLRCDCDTNGELIPTFTGRNSISIIDHLLISASANVLYGHPP